MTSPEPQVISGLRDVLACESSVGFIDGQQGVLRYRGYDIHDFVERADFLDVVYLLWYGRWPYKYQNASKHGAAGAIIIHTTPSAGYPWQVLANSASGTHQDLPPSPGDPKNMQFQGWITESAAMQVAKLAGADLDQLRKDAQEKGFKAQPHDVALSLEMAVGKKKFERYPSVSL